VKADLPILRDHLNDVERDINTVKDQLQKAQRWQRSSPNTDQSRAPQGTQYTIEERQSCAVCERRKNERTAKPIRVQSWKLIGDNLSKAGWSWSCVSAIDSNGRTIFVADAHREENRRFVVRADEKLRAFMELESAIRAGGELA
jgi:hypothetical protein